MARAAGKQSAFRGPAYRRDAVARTFDVRQLRHDVARLDGVNMANKKPPARFEPAVSALALMTD
ncbi:MAG: hypothetical protein GC152_10590 [Alphaproteobacteria bacterium]|nr:hypothetical protein [Alphaproteobacteria bacterium]